MLLHPTLTKAQDHRILTAACWVHISLLHFERAVITLGITAWNKMSTSLKALINLCHAKILPVTSAGASEIFTVATFHMTSGTQFKTRKWDSEGFIGKSFIMHVNVHIKGHLKIAWLAHELKAVALVLCAIFSSQKIQTRNWDGLKMEGPD